MMFCSFYSLCKKICMFCARRCADIPIYIPWISHYPPPFFLAKSLVQGGGGGGGVNVISTIPIYLVPI